MSKARIAVGVGGAGGFGLTWVLDRIWMEPEPWVLWTVGAISAALILLAVFGPIVRRLLVKVLRTEGESLQPSSVGSHSANVRHVTAGRDVTVNVGDHKNSSQEMKSPPSPVVTPELLAEFEQLHEEGTKLLTRNKPLSPGEWRQRIIMWFDRAEELMAKYRPSEAFMFRTISRKPGVSEKFDDCPRLLEPRLTKLRLIIGRMHSRET